MEVIFILIPLALILVGIIIGVFWWATQSGQFDDLEGPAHRILMDEDRIVEPPEQPPGKPHRNSGDASVPRSPKGTEG